jgi:hypothetical protein
MQGAGATGAADRGHCCGGTALLAVEHPAADRVGGPDTCELAVLERPFTLLANHGLVGAAGDEGCHVVGAAPQAECVPVGSVVEGAPA